MSGPNWNFSGGSAYRCQNLIRRICPEDVEKLSAPNWHLPVVVEKAALRGRFGHLRSQIFRHIEIAVTLSADELDVQPVFGRVIVEMADGC